MKERERRRILDEIAYAMHSQSKPEDYAASVDQLVEAGMSLDAIEAEVNDRISRIQTDEEIDNLRNSVKKKGLLFGGITAVALLLLSLIGSYLLMQTVLPAPEPTPTPTATPAPVAIAEQPTGHWLFSIETREVQPALGDPTQAIVTVHIIGKDGNPAPDGLEMHFSVTSGDITPRTAIVRNGVLTALYIAATGAPPATLSVTMQNDEASHQMPAFGPGGMAQEQTPTQTPTPEVTPSPTPETPTPAPEPVDVTVGWTPRYSTTIEIGVGQALTITLDTRQQGEAAPNTEVNIAAVNGFVSFDGNSSTTVTTDEKGMASLELVASQNQGDDTLQVSGASVAATQFIQVRVLPVATTLKDLHLRTEPVMAKDKWVSQTAEKSGSSFVILGTHPCYNEYGTDEAGIPCYLVRDSGGSKAWLEGSDGAISIEPLDAKVEDVARDAATDTIDASTSSSDEDSSTSQVQLRLSGGDTSDEANVPLFGDDSGQKVLAELPTDVTVELLEDTPASDFLSVRVVLWVPVDNVTGTEPNQTLTNPSSTVDVCVYQPDKSPEDDGDKYCGTLAQITPAISFARSLTETEKADETTFGQSTWKLAVIDAWVKRDNIK